MGGHGVLQAAAPGASVKTKMLSISSNDVTSSVRYGTFRPVSTFPVCRDFVDENTGKTITKPAGHRLAGGAYSDVYQGILTTPEGYTMQVAIKELRVVMHDNMEKSINREVSCWAPLEHKNIARFIGILYQSSGVPALISPWYMNGASDRYLQANPHIDRIVIVRGIVDGLAYLHENAIVHGDLKAANILIDDDNTPMIADFGLSRILGQRGFTTSSPKMTVRWCAPEIFFSAGLTKESDMYAFATTVCEILSSTKPHARIKSDHVVFLEVCMNKLHPFDPQDVPCSAELWSLLASCWTDPASRPTIQEVAEHFENTTT